MHEMQIRITLDVIVNNFVGTMKITQTITKQKSSQKCMVIYPVSLDQTVQKKHCLYNLEPVIFSTNEKQTKTDNFDLHDWSE